MKETVDYVFVEKPSSEFYSVKLLTGKYSNVIYTYGKVSISEDEKNDLARLHFQFKIEETPNSIDHDLMKDETFMNYIGDILSCILQENEFKIGKK
jgi:hypothetical protein